MVVIRLSRGGSKGEPRYRITVADRRRAATAKFLEVVGHYYPMAKGQQKKVDMNLDRIDYWVSCGAQPTRTVSSLIRKWKESNA